MLRDMSERVEALVGQQAYKFHAMEERLKDAQTDRDKAQHELDNLVEALVEHDNHRCASAAARAPWLAPHSILHQDGAFVKLTQLDARCLMSHVPECIRPYIRTQPAVAKCLFRLLRGPRCLFIVHSAPTDACTMS
jgi:hypothetical protein